MGFLVPTARRLGTNEGVPYLNRFLDHPWFSRYIGGVEGLAVLTGLILFWNASGGLQGTWLSQPQGIAFSVGGLAAIAALIVSGPLSGTLSALYSLGDDGAAAGRDLAFEQSHRRLASIARAYLSLLVVAVAGMASAQYLV
jgi:hypothetical protein